MTAECAVPPGPNQASKMARLPARTANPTTRCRSFLSSMPLWIDAAGWSGLDRGDGSMQHDDGEEHGQNFTGGGNGKGRHAPGGTLLSRVAGRNGLGGATACPPAGSTAAHAVNTCSQIEPPAAVGQTTRVGEAMSFTLTSSFPVLQASLDIRLPEVGEAWEIWTLADSLRQYALWP